MADPIAWSSVRRVEPYASPVAESQESPLELAEAVRRDANRAVWLGLASLFTCMLTGPFALFYGWAALRRANHGGTGFEHLGAAKFGLAQGLVHSVLLVAALVVVIWAALNDAGAH